MSDKALEDCIDQGGEADPDANAKQQFVDDHPCFACDKDERDYLTKSHSDENAHEAGQPYGS
jgi:hypothetical protein